ncbi:hypothetical protein Ahy_A06g028802 [Arachis hypogaea]|uniref:Uncharacterized protein n=1 Tax=Arachis hypogaea TaxID=3818 RepID=A0A445CRV8_ARAHY|nr:hypothetical protein Ahy_A06g028802 [Arachis hypogaea]
MTRGRGVMDRPCGHSRGIVSNGILGTSQSSPCTLTMPVMSQAMDAPDQPFIMVPNTNYVAPSTLTMPLRSTQYPTVSTTSTSAKNIAVLESSHGSQPDAPPLPPIEKFIWNKTHDAIIKKIFPHRMARRLPQMLQDIRKLRDHLTTWLHLDIKKALYVHWETDEGFKHHHLMNRANKVSARSSKYTGGLETFMMTKVRLPNRDDGNNYATSVIDPDMVWRDEASEPYKNLVYRL